MMVSLTLPPVVVHIMSVLAVSPAASSATANRSAVWFGGTTIVEGETMTFDGGSSDRREGILQATNARTPTRTTSRIRASRQESLCLKVMTRVPQKKPPASIDVGSLAARRTWRFGSL